MVNGRGDTSPRFDALPRGNGRWRSRKTVGGERFAGLRIVWRKETIEPGALRWKEKEKESDEAGLVAVREREVSLLQIPGQGLVATLAGDAQAQARAQASQAQFTRCWGPAALGTGESTFLPAHGSRPFHLQHTQTWTEIFATTAQLSPAKYTIQQVRHSPSDSSSKGNTPLSLAQAQVWVQVQALMWPAVSQSSALAKSKSLVCLLARPAKAQLVPGTAAGCSETMKGVTGVCPFREACHCAIVSLTNPNPLQGTLQARRWCMSFDDLIIQHPSEHSLGAAIHTCH